MHADVVAAIESRGGRLVASFVLDAHGQTEGAPRGRKQHACSGCGETGHAITRCNGPGNPPRLAHHERRRADAATPEYRQILADRAAARRKR